MWWDELNDPEYQDRPLKYIPASERPPFFHQPVTTYTKYILNAVTGEEYPYRIGSNDERRFYVVMENDPDNPREARRLFFNSPQQYEAVTGIRVSNKSKERFNNNQLLFR
jgi:hypothetical protein